MVKETMRIHVNDNVAVALRELKAGELVQISDRQIVVHETISQGHKLAIATITPDQDIVKYGFPIGHATVEIGVGEWVHTHNTKTNLKGIENYQYHPRWNVNPYELKNMTFKGYRRQDGRVGIRNELWIIPTVGCVNGVAEAIMTRFKETVGIAPFENTLVLKHNYGCSQLGEDHIHTKTMLQNAVRHPNAGGVLVLGLGCENNEMTSFKESLGQYDAERVKFLISQEVSNEIEEGVKLLLEIHQAAEGDQRRDVPLSELRIGLKCGGSDGFSGITANPLLGRLSDFLVAQGGTTVLTEVPEMFGAETLLMERAANEKVFHKIVALINDFKQYFLEYNQPVYENPSPGNKAGGITTLEDKSLGCTQKAGTSTIMDVLKYGETLQSKGLNLLSAPGNDLVAASALAAAGCQLVLFTTGRGTPFGTFVPTVKVSTNSAIYHLKRHWIDYNAGTLAKGAEANELLTDFVSYIISVASGEQVNNEKNDFREIAIFKSGVTL
ncbi:UxaA family hydrolase [Paenibacillus crassostreae]|uniref:Altronate hydrolase n=1 Tax=Paenibacillus crassostreae TaxID=1763538 RepID=A0A167B042_9BACL|nr:altronate dehydratase family protein [Paenibacillus crassostreae]AOZ93587.1 altronate hydrolase [Paenibacillus crassostreae]OAB71619.1 altronate hydrolase [Paenibacillus crassostreae]